MNRLVLIGNGVDLAHGLKTSYTDFINWYWDYRVNGFVGNLTLVSQDPLSTFEDYHGMNNHKDYRCNNKGRATDTIKQHIENNYATFDDAYYANFQPVLDKLLELFNL